VKSGVGDFPYIPEALVLQFLCYSKGNMSVMAQFVAALADPIESNDAAAPIVKPLQERAARSRVIHSLLAIRPS
jgi:hypothetical protein